MSEPELTQSSIATNMATSNSIASEGADLHALNESVIGNVFDDSGFRSTLHSTATLQMQQPIWILSTTFITEDEAEDFLAQANRSPNLKLNECMGNTSINLLNIKIMTDTNFTMLPRLERGNWKNALSITQIAQLVVQYFGAKMDDDKTLAENFAKVPFHYSLEKHDYELATYLLYKDLVHSYERKSPISPSQHKELITILEKRLPIGSRILSDYREAKAAASSQDETWHEALERFIECLDKARVLISISKSYGPTNVVYSFPATAKPPLLTNGKGGNAPQTLAVRAPQTMTTLPKVSLAHRDDTIALQVITPKVCHSCGSTGHNLHACPVLYMTDSNCDHHIPWAESTLGKAWLVQGYDEHQSSLGYDEHPWV